MTNDEASLHQHGVFVLSILQKLFGAKGAAKGNGRGEVFLAAFGKHPGWNDFMDDLGLDTPRLIETRRLLLGAIDANAEGWERLEESRRLANFRHALVWQPGGGDSDIVVARFWSSSDGKGRK